MGETEAEKAILESLPTSELKTKYQAAIAQKYEIVNSTPSEKYIENNFTSILIVHEN